MGCGFGAPSSAAARPQAIVTLGAAAGGVLGGWLVDRAGRKLSLLLCSVPFVAGFAVITAAQDLWMLLGGRLLTGLACGVASLVAPVSVPSRECPVSRGLRPRRSGQTAPQSWGRGFPWRDLIGARLEVPALSRGSSRPPWEGSCSSLHFTLKS